MKKKFFLLSILILAVFLFASCTNNVDGDKYKSMWNEKEYFTFHDGKYAFVSEDGKDSGTYVQNKDELTVTDKHKKTVKYKVYKNYLLDNAYTGDVPASTVFFATCTNKTVTFKFNDDGTMSRTKQVLDITSKASGTYKRMGDIITFKLDNGEKHSLLVNGKTLYEAYEKQ